MREIIQALGSCGVPARVTREHRSYAADAYELVLRDPSDAARVYGAKVTAALRHCLGSSRVGVQEHRGRPLVLLLKDSPLPVDLRLLWNQSFPRPLAVPIGFAWDGGLVWLDFRSDRGRNILVGGMNGCGKSGVLTAILAGLGVGTPVESLEIIAIDCKAVVGSTPFHGPLARLPHLRYAPILAHSENDLGAASRMLVSEMDHRRAHPSSRLLAVLIDEAHRMPQDALSELVKEGRGLGMFFALTTQFQRERDSLGRGVWSQIHTRILGRSAIGDWYTQVGLIGDARAAESLPGGGTVYARIGADLILTRVAFSPEGSGLWAAPGWAARGAGGERPGFSVEAGERPVRINENSKTPAEIPESFMEWLRANSSVGKAGNVAMPGEHKAADKLVALGYGKNYRAVRRARKIVASDLARGARGASDTFPSEEA